MHKLRVLVLMTLAMAFGGAARAQAPYPDRSVRVVVGFAAGGGADASARLVMAKVGELLKTDFIIDNRGGAGGMPATALVAESKPDGYTLLWGSVGAFALSPALGLKSSYDPLHSFAPISMTAVLPNVMVVSASSPIKSVQQLIAQAHAAPGRLSYGTPGIGSAGHTSGQLLLDLAKIDMTHVPYRGGSQLVTDVINGQLTVGFVTVSTVETLGRDRVRPLAVTSAQRNPVLPDVPTFAEAGVPGYEADFWFGLLAPKGTPPEIVAKLNAAVRTALADPQVNKGHLALGFLSAASTPEEFAQVIARDHEKWGKVLTKLH
ncbi:MAG TPA: tripartite tricarboxylate transporter substrate-binding protein [Burkholderiaceae bacterium]|jgi:tripartite-type tricarboxylate transporter receptor subunit TctC